MQRHPDLIAEALQRGAAPGRGYAVGRMISQILHPVILGVFSVLIVGLFAVKPLGEGMRWALFCILFQVGLPTAFFIFRMRQGAYSDEDVSVRSQRNELYLFGMANTVLVALVLWLLRAPSPFLALLIVAALVNVLSWLINLWWKISIHAASMGSCATLATLYSQPLGIGLWGCALALGWARVRTRNHTPAQVVAGLALATAVVLGVWRAFGLV